ncbi:hypothetical protein [Novosphingobium lindaniclasticum]|uniref:Uncharacterized protein n=1 Tax=Novosphingobium lindaniclasticum LE124 TaxID=1096930 RepID=T0HC87_9SPHN|nr:hypothetical protein [Novosphingobium lindaniclasticum]EQB09738.1 hypothetical protein L284_19250 [Novosphingobium lindaniclasticum LE124]
MAEKGIIFSAAMVVALLAGRKTQTRRLIKLPKEFSRPDMGGWEATATGGEGVFTIAKGKRLPVPERAAIWNQTTGTTIGMPYAVGDKLYVRETCRAIERKSGQDQFQYRATIDREDEDAENVPNEPDAGGWGDLSIYGRGKRDRKNFATCDDDLTFAGPWVPAIHAPRSTSRLWLAVTDVRVQRLQECSEADAKAEGIEGFACIGGQAWRDYSGGPGFNMTDPRTPARRSYSTLWDSLHTAEGARWQDNPWIVAVSFDVHRGNIDAETANG